MPVRLPEPVCERGSGEDEKVPLALIGRAMLANPHAGGSQTEQDQSEYVARRHHERPDNSARRRGFRSEIAFLLGRGIGVRGHVWVLD